MRAVTGWLVAYLFRWFPHSDVAGLRKVGSPDAKSPVLVTCNFTLTVKRVLNAIKGLDLWLLVAPSDGINVWCASCGGIFTHNRVIDAVKVSGLSEKVEHRDIILPALSAPAMDKKAISRETGFHARFGPVHASDIPEYLSAGKKKTAQMCRFRFDVKHRLDMLVSMNFITYLPAAVVLGIFWPQHLLTYTLLFWGAVSFLYIFVNYLPGRSGWTQVFISALALVIIWALVDWANSGDAFLHWGWFVASFVIFFAAGFDLAGTATGRKSDPTELFERIGIKSLGRFYREKASGLISLDREKCNGCETCIDICPLEIFKGLDEDKKTTFRDRKACFECGACVMQCPEGALSLSK